MTRNVAVAHFGGLPLACFQGDDKIEEKSLKGGRPLDDIDLLPQVLKEQSLSDREIVLTPENASRAVDFLEAAQWAVVGWEPWLKLADGSHLHQGLAVIGTRFAQQERNQSSMAS
jgi:hypothetical protein